MSAGLLAAGLLLYVLVPGMLLTWPLDAAAQATPTTTAAPTNAATALERAIRPVDETWRAALPLDAWLATQAYWTG